MEALLFILIAFIVIFIIVYRRNNGENVYKYIVTNTTNIYNKYAPYSYKMVRDRVRELKRDYSVSQYSVQVILFMVASFAITYLYFYNILISVFYSLVVVFFVPYLTYLRYKRIYSEFIFEQIQTYTTNTIMEFATTQSFVKALEGVYESGVLEDPVLSDVKVMIDMSYRNGTIYEAVDYFNSKYPFYIVKNMHQLFIQITAEGSKDASKSFENMLLDIDMLIESVYRDRLDRDSFHKKFLQFGVILYFMVMLVQFLLTIDTYIKALNNPIVNILLHVIVIINSFFLLKGEKYYNENVGAE